MIKSNLFLFSEDEIRPIAPSFTEYLRDIVLKDGEKCVLRARVTGTPGPQITWFKDGIPIQNTNVDYKVITI